MIIGWITVFLILVISTSFTLYLSKRAGCIPQTLVALAIQILLSAIFLATWGLRDDTLTYHNAAILLVDTWNNGLDPNYTLPEGKRSTVLVAGMFYWLVGPYPLVVLLFSATITAWLPSLLATSTKLFGFTRASKWAAWLGAIAPPMLLWAPWLTRESLAFVLLGVSTVIFGLIFRQKFNVVTLIMWLVTAWLMSVTRPQLLLVLATGTLASLILSRKPPTPRTNNRERARFTGGLALATTLPLIAIGWVFTASDTSRTVQSEVRTAIVNELSGPASTLGVTYEGPTTASELDSNDSTSTLTIETNNDSTSTLTIETNNDSTSTLTIETNNDSTSTLTIETNPVSNLVSQNLYRGVNSLIGPFPWNWESMPWIIAGLDGVMMLLVWIVILLGAVRYKSTRRMTFILVAACLPLIAGEAYFHANFGITMRVRAHYLVLLLPALAVIVTSVCPRLNNTFESLRNHVTMKKERNANA